MTTSKIAIGQTLYSLLFKTGAIIPIEVVNPIARYHLQDQKNNDEILIQDLHIVDELRDLARIRIASHQQRIGKSYNKNIKVKTF